MLAMHFGDGLFAQEGGLLGYLLATLAVWLRALVAAPLLAWGQVSKVADSRGSLKATLACVIQLGCVPRNMPVGRVSVYACAVV